MCLYPKLIKNRKYTANKKNKGIIPEATDERVLLVPVGCGRCIECCKQKAKQWQVRLQEEIRHDKNGKFVTLTFSNENYAKLAEEINAEGYELDNEIATLATRRFLERWRKKHKKSVKHWLITELGEGGTENIHMHGIIWTGEVEDIKTIWGYGYVYIGEYVNEITINYISKYLTKRDKKHCEYQNKILTSKGIGRGYIQRDDSKRNIYKEGNTKETYTTRQGQQINLPIYYRNKIYNENEREKLWLEKLDKQERYVLGQKINVSSEQGIKAYEQAVKIARQKNKRLGYGDDEKSWDKKLYENQIRTLKQKERIKNGKLGKIQNVQKRKSRKTR